MTDHHFLIVPDKPDDDLDIEHPPGCPTEQSAWDTNVHVYSCDVANLIYEAGLSDYFYRSDDPDKYGVLVTPGRHPIAYWSSKTYSHYYGTWEYDNGLCLVEDERGA